MAADIRNEVQLLVDCDVAHALDRDHVVQLMLEYTTPGSTNSQVTYLLVTVEMAAKLHEQLVDALQITVQ